MFSLRSHIRAVTFTVSQLVLYADPRSAAVYMMCEDGQFPPSQSWTLESVSWLRLVSGGRSTAQMPETETRSVFVVVWEESETWELRSWGAIITDRLSLLSVLKHLLWLWIFICLTTHAMEACSTRKGNNCYIKKTFLSLFSIWEAGTMACSYMKTNRLLKRLIFCKSINRQIISAHFHIFCVQKS